MARQKKQVTDAELAKMRDVEAYTHDDKMRTNNPPVGMAHHDKAEEKVKTYQFDPHLDPTLQWAGKAEGTSFDVPTSSIHIHESIKPHSIVSRVMREYSNALEGQLEGQQSMFEAETPAERMRRRRESIEFYQHGVNWTNRMIAGDSLVIMNSLLEKEGMAGQVQMVYIDPPYGIKYGSNFQPFVDKRDVKDKISALWLDTGLSSYTDEKIYVVQTGTKAIERCILMSTDPGDLVLDITCGSGTTAFVAEKWGRRWITCDTSRVAITLAKQRLTTASYDYFELAHEDQGVSSGFKYNTANKVTIKSIVQGHPLPPEPLYDQPIIDKNKVRITGPFTVEALPAPVVRPLDDISETDEDISAKQTDWRDQLRATGILGRGGSRLEFTRVEPLSGTKYLQAEAETKESNPRRAVICFAGETKPLDSRMVAMALDEAEMLRPAPKLIIFAAFQFDPEAAKTIDEMQWPGVTLLKAQMNTDLMTEDLKKKRSSDQSFWLVGQPDVELIRDGRSKTKFKVKVNGFDYYDVKKGTVESGSTSRIAMWMLDTDYDGMCIEPKQVFFPMGGKKDGWNKLAKTLKAEVDPELIEKYAGNESLWFRAEPNSRIAVKIIDDRGIESLKVIRIGDE